MSDIDALTKRIKALESSVNALSTKIMLSNPASVAGLDFNDFIGTINAGNITAGSIDTTKLNVDAILVFGLILTSNSPAGGSVAWSACTVYVAGVAYPITAGNTASMQIYWNLGDGTFTGATTFVAQPGRYGIATNTLGIADAIWNKLGKSSVQEDHLSFGLITGTDPQPFVTGTIAPAISTSVNLITLSGYKGGILAVGFEYTTLLVGGTPNIYLRFKIDGGANNDVLLFSAGAGKFDPAALRLSQNNSGDGSVVGNRLSLTEGFGFSTSLQVDLIATNVGGITQGDFTCSVAYAARAN